MLNHLKNAINKKKLYFVLKHSKSNIKILNDLMYLNIISGYNSYIKKKKTYLVIFIHYDTNVNSTISELAKTGFKYYTLKKKDVNTNFILYIKNRKIDPTNTLVKFR